MRYEGRRACFSDHPREQLRLGDCPRCDDETKMVARICGIIRDGWTAHAPGLSRLLTGLRAARAPRIGPQTAAGIVVTVLSNPVARAADIGLCSEVRPDGRSRASGTLHHRFLPRDVADGYSSGQIRLSNHLHTPDCTRYCMVELPLWRGIAVDRLAGASCPAFGHAYLIVGSPGRRSLSCNRWLTNRQTNTRLL